jgi:hypothetical protein
VVEAVLAVLDWLLPLTRFTRCGVFGEEMTFGRFFCVVRFSGSSSPPLEMVEGVLWLAPFSRASTETWLLRNFSFNSVISVLAAYRVNTRN